jgi:membrane protein YqaA with SNARE-associated domain
LVTGRDWSIILGTFVYCIGSAVIPVMHAEAYLITVSALAPPALAWAMVFAATAGQMVGKVGMYWAGRGVLRLPSERMRRRLAAVRARYEDHRGVGNGLIFLSASSGLPPFYAIAVAAGMLRVPLRSFISFGTAGRFLRFAATVFLPHLIKRAFGG